MIWSVPTGKLEMVRVAIPLDPRFAIPSAFPSWLKETVPVAAGPDPLAGATVAVNVTGAPDVAEGAELTSDVLEAAVVTCGVIVWLRADEALPR